MNLPFTVLVARPDYVSDDQLDDVFVDHVMADDPEQAKAIACAHVAKVDKQDASDYRAFMVFAGHHEEL